MGSLSIALPSKGFILALMLAMCAVIPSSEGQNQPSGAFPVLQANADGTDPSADPTFAALRSRGYIIPDPVPMLSARVAQPIVIDLK